MASKALRRSVTAVGVAGGLYGLWQAHRAAQRALGDVLLATQAEPVLEPVADQVGEVLRRVFGQAPASRAAPFSDPYQNTRHNDWPGLLYYLGQINDEWQAGWPSLRFDPWEGINGTITFLEEDYRTHIQLVQDGWGVLEDFFSEAWGVGWDLASAFISGAREYAARLLGMATGDQLGHLASWVRNLADRLNYQYLDLAVDLRKVLRWSVGVTQRLDKIGMEFNTLYGRTYNQFDQIRSIMFNGLAVVQTEIEALQGDVGHITETLPALDPQAVPDMIRDDVAMLLPQAVVDTFPLVLPVVAGQVVERIVATPGYLDMLRGPAGAPGQVPGLGDLPTRVADLARESADNAACCAANADALNRSRPDLDALHKLLAALSVLFAATTADDLLELIVGWVDGSGVDFANLLGGWLTGEIDPATIAAEAVGGIIGDIVP